LVSCQVRPFLQHFQQEGVDFVQFSQVIGLHQLHSTPQDGRGWPEESFKGEATLYILP
jgi:hypothetical protein